MEIKSLDDDGLARLINEEGLILHPYLDSKGIPTIGVGNTYYEDGRRVTMKDPSISRERAYCLFRNILAPYEKTVYSVTRDDINQKQFDALVSLVYNIGVTAFKGSTLLKKVNINPQDLTILDAFLAWRNSGGKPVLLNRRKREAKLYFS